MNTGLPRFVQAGLAGFALLVLAPLLVVIALIVKLSSPGPILFRQNRVGRGGLSFTLIKFRTMSVANDGPQLTARDDARITKIGAVLRHSKLDELPELWNVLVGDLALVGPRPEVPSMVDLDDPRWQRLLTVRPGLTDPVTLRLRDEEKLLAEVAGDRVAFYRDLLLPWKLDNALAYLESRTAWSDLKVLAATTFAILFGPTRPAPSEAELRLGLAGPSKN